MRIQSEIEFLIWSGSNLNKSLKSGHNLILWMWLIFFLNSSNSKNFLKSDNLLVLDMSDVYIMSDNYITIYITDPFAGRIRPAGRTLPIPILSSLNFLLTFKGHDFFGLLDKNYCCI